MISYSQSLSSLSSDDLPNFPFSNRLIEDDVQAIRERHGTNDERSVRVLKKQNETNHAKNRGSDNQQIRCVITNINDVSDTKNEEVYCLQQDMSGSIMALSHEAQIDTHAQLQQNSHIKELESQANQGASISERKTQQSLLSHYRSLLCQDHVEQLNQDRMHRCQLGTEAEFNNDNDAKPPPSLCIVDGMANLSANSHSSGALSSALQSQSREYERLHQAHARRLQSQFPRASIVQEGVISHATSSSAHSSSGSIHQETALSLGLEEQISAYNKLHQAHIHLQSQRGQLTIVPGIPLKAASEHSFDGKNDLSGDNTSAIGHCSFTPDGEGVCTDEAASNQDSKSQWAHSAFRLTSNSTDNFTRDPVQEAATCSSIGSVSIQETDLKSPPEEG